jgi:hypothetical protein
LEYIYFMEIGQPKLSERDSEASRQQGGRPGHTSGEQNVSKGSFLDIVPLPAYRQAGKAGRAVHVPAKKVG